MPEGKQVPRGLWRWTSVTESSRQPGVGFVLAGALAIFLQPDAVNTGLLPVILGWGFLFIGWIR